ncbi:MAG: glycosyltransferase family 2 protein [Solirubrobacteraceae bacterium]
MTDTSPRVALVIPNWNGLRWLPDCLEAVARQQPPASQVIVVDNGSHDGSVAYLLSDAIPLGLTVLELSVNTGFAHAANRGIAHVDAELVALINTDVVIADDWIRRMASALESDRRAASVACKMLSMHYPGEVYDAGDILRRDGACEQRGRRARDDGRWDTAGEVFGACAGAALYRRDAVLSVGGFDERYFAYLEDVDLALRLRLSGWRCRYEPVVALHASEGSATQLPGGSERLVARNTVLLVAKWFPIRWLPIVAYRQLGWAWHALLERRLRQHMRALSSAAGLLPQALRQRRQLRAQAMIPIAEAVPARPFRGPRAGGHPAEIANRQPR